MDPTTPAKLSFSFKAKIKPSKAPVIPTQPSAFASLDEELDVPAPSLAKPGKSGPRSLVPAQATMTKAMKKEMEQQKKVDATVYEYDEVYDSLKEAERQAVIAREEEAKIRQPKYIGNLLQAADQRKRDHLIAEEKMIQRERELEGDEFADRDKFMTQAYKDQLVENRKAEEAEKLREELEKNQKGKAGPGMTHFYASLLKQSDEKHAAVMAAASKLTIGPTLPEAGPSLAIKPPTESRDLSDLEKAKLARAQGKDVELNDDNQIVDKRDLLSAGLNLTGRNTRDLAAYRQSKDGNKDEPVVVHTAVGAAASRREIDARRRREVEVQLKEEEERKEAQRLKEEEESRQRAVKRKNDDDSITSARERYLERKRRKLEQPPPLEED